MENAQELENAGWTRVPHAARWLGLAGLIPFFGCAIIILLPSSVAQNLKIMAAILVYGVAILFFLGGVA